MGGTVARGIPQGGASGRQGGDAAGGIDEQGPEDAGGTLGTVVVQADVLLAQPSGAGVDGLGSEDILAGSHGFLLG